jgi:photosystem II stability/assembly factor-like uncharacterized protein
MKHEWNYFPQIIVPTPVLALVAGPGGLWASGPGGVAWHAADNEWRSRISGLPLTDVAALIYAGGWLIAGGAEGIARSPNGGVSWQSADIQGGATGVASMVASPNFNQDTTALAATLGGGIMRTEDAGKTWKPATFGLQDFEVTALAWGAGETVLAATADGIYRSPNGGRAWRLCPGSEGSIIAALAFLPNGDALAALEVGGLLRSTDGGQTWEPFSDLPENLEATALFITHDGVVLLGTIENVLRSVDGGQTWDTILDMPVYTFAADDSSVYAGTSEGIVGLWADMAANLDILEWRTLRRPPLHDLRRLLIIDGRPLVAGIRSAPVTYLGNAWSALENVPLPLTALASAPDGALWASSPDGLFRSSDSGSTWTDALVGEEGFVTRISFRDNGQGWAASGARLLYTTDAGATWQPLDSPFGVLPLSALQALPDQILAGTYDPRRKVAQLWRSFDDGRTWERGAEVQTTWPAVATFHQPPLLTLGSVMFRRNEQGTWDRILVGADGGAVRRVVGAEGTLLALTTTGIQRSNDGGTTWERDDEGLPIAQVMDLAISGSTLYVLLAGGQVWSRAL